MVEEKGLDEAVADEIKNYVLRSGKAELLEELSKDEKLVKHQGLKQGLEEMGVLLRYCELYQILDSVVFDLGLARGLDYYTGVIYEAVLCGDKVEVGSVAGGGRYDNLVGVFDSKSKSSPCVGMSLGIERIFSVLENKKASQGLKTRTTEVDVFVASAQKNLIEERMRLIVELWNAGIKAEQSYKKNPKLLQQLQHCEDYQIPLAIILGENEIKQNKVTLRNVKTREESSVPRQDLVGELQKRIKQLQLNSI